MYSVRGVEIRECGKWDLGIGIQGMSGLDVLSEGRGIYGVRQVGIRA